MTAKNSRRDFLKTTATLTTTVAVANLLPATVSAKTAARGVAIILNPDDAKQRPAQWGAAELRDALKTRGIAAEIFEKLEQAPADFECVVAATASSSAGKQALTATGASLPKVPEVVGLALTRRWSTP